MNNKPKALAFDLDGTLTPSKSHLEADMAKVLIKLLEHMPFAIVSGASWKQFETQLLGYFPRNEKNFDNLYLFSENGASLTVHKDGVWSTQYRNSFDDIESTKIIKELNKIVDKYELSRNLGFGELIENRGAQITLSALGQKAPLELKEKWDPDQVKRKAMKIDLDLLLSDYEIRIGGSTSIDITKKGINKAMAINKFLEILKIQKEELIFFGDATFSGGNDEIVKETGVECRQVDNPEQTIAELRDIISLYEKTDRHSSMG